MEDAFSWRASVSNINDFVCFLKELIMSDNLEKGGENKRGSLASSFLTSNSSLFMNHKQDRNGSKYTDSII